MSHEVPPRFAERLITWTVAAEDCEVLLGDLAEEFHHRASDRGLADARRWYWRQCLRSLWANMRGRRDAYSASGSRQQATRGWTAAFRGLGRDCRHAFRSLRAEPGVTAIALVVLTLGIGASTAIFSVVDAVVLRDLPFARSGDLVVVGETLTTGGRARQIGVPPPDYLDWNAQQDVFDGVAAWVNDGEMTLESNEPERLRAISATANLFTVLETFPARGTPFTVENEAIGANHVAVLSDAFWRRRYGADPGVVGRSMTIDGATWQILGVMPKGFEFPVGRLTDIWIPHVIPTAERVRGVGHSQLLQLIARLRPGATVDLAHARVDAITANLAERFPDWFRNRKASIRPLREALIDSRIESWMLMLLGAVMLVLLIACVNVASLMLARATARSRDLGVRAALGASRWQIVRGVLIESLCIAMAGTALGVLATKLGISGIRAALPAQLPRSTSIAVNGRVLLAAVAASVLTGLACGILPALQGARADVVRTLRESSRATSASRSRQRLRAGLVVAEVGLAVVLLVGAGLFIHSFVRLSSVDLGLNYEHVLTVGLVPRGGSAADRRAAAPRVASLVNDVLPAVRSVPGVQYVAALSGTRPFEGGSDRTNAVVRGHEGEFRSDDDAVDVYHVTPDYVKAVGVRLVRGRSFEPTENDAAVPVVILNETAAARFFAGADPVGQSIGILGDRTVVGVVHDVRVGGPETNVRPEAYVPFAAVWAPGAFLVVRTHDDAGPIIPAIKAAVWSVAPDVPLSDIRTLEEFLARLVAQRKFNMLLIGLFGALALTIASVGIFGVMAYIVEQRRSEIGLRMALGAERREVVSMVLRRAFVIVSIGLAAGLGVAWPLSQTLGAFLFEVRPHDATVYAAAAGVLLAAGLFAAFVPARRAANIDPVVALRAD